MPSNFLQDLYSGNNNNGQFSGLNQGDTSGIFNGSSPNQGSLFGDQGFGFNSGTFGAVGGAINGLSQLSSLYFGNKKLKLAEEQFDTNKAFANRNNANQARTINNSLEARYRAALAQSGVGLQGGGNKESLQSYLDRSKVDGSAIGEG